MKNERILDALEMVDVELIEEAAPGNKPPKTAKNKVWMKWGAMVACVLVIVGISIPFFYNRSGENAEDQLSNGSHENGSNSSAAADSEPMEKLTLEDAVTDKQFGDLFPTSILDGYVLQGTVAVMNDTVLVANFYNEALGDELTIRIASREWFYNQKKDLVKNTVLYREKDGASYIYIAGGEKIVQYTFSKTDIAENEQFCDMLYSAPYFSECMDYPNIIVNE